MNWLKRLLGASKAPQKRNPIAIPADGMPKTAGKRARPPSRSRKLTPEEREQEIQRYIAERRQIDSDRWEFDAGRVKLAGVTHYRWQSAGDSDVCDVCRRHNGKRFSYDRAPSGGHPGDGHVCGNGEVCRCYAEPIIR